MRDNKSIISFAEQLAKRQKELELQRTLKKEVNIGAHGTQDYIIKKGKNKGKKAET
jgi:hypothetical protein